MEQISLLAPLSELTIGSTPPNLGCLALDDAVFLSIASVGGASDTTRSLFRSIAVVGGGAFLPGLGACLEARVSARLPHFFGTQCERAEVLAWPRVCNCFHTWLGLLFFIFRWIYRTRTRGFWPGGVQQSGPA